jgi:hypothetical protein
MPGPWSRSAGVSSSAAAFQAVLAAVLLHHPQRFPVDGTLIQAWASHKSFVPKDRGSADASGGGGRNALADWRGKPCGTDTHASTSDPDARLLRKVQESLRIPRRRTIVSFKEVDPCALAQSVRPKLEILDKDEFGGFNRHLQQSFGSKKRSGMGDRSMRSTSLLAI